MQDLQRRERVLEKIVLLLLELEQHPTEPDRTYDIVCIQAADMAYRAHKALEDPTWWVVGGRPYFNERMARIRSKLKKKRRRLRS